MFLPNVLSSFSYFEQRERVSFKFLRTMIGKHLFFSRTNKLMFTQ